MEDISTISHNRTPIDDFQFQFDKKRRFRFFQTFPPKEVRWGRAFQFFLKKLAGIRNAPRETEWIEFGGKFTNNS